MRCHMNGIHWMHGGMVTMIGTLVGRCPKCGVRAQVMRDGMMPMTGTMVETRKRFLRCQTKRRIGRNQQKNRRLEV